VAPEPGTSQHCFVMFRRPHHGNGSYGCRQNFLHVTVASQGSHPLDFQLNRYNSAVCVKNQFSRPATATVSTTGRLRRGVGEEKLTDGPWAFDLRSIRSSHEGPEVCKNTRVQLFVYWP